MNREIEYWERLYLDDRGEHFTLDEVVNDGREVRVRLTYRVTKEVTLSVEGAAYCLPSDVFQAHTGREIALRRAFKKMTGALYDAADVLINEARKVSVYRKLERSNWADD